MLTSSWTKTVRKDLGGGCYHCYVDVGQRKVVDDKVRCNFYCHAGDCERVLPETGILKDVGQADEGYVLVHTHRKQFLFFSFF